MEKNPLQLCVLFIAVVLLANAIAVGCFPSSQENSKKLNSTVPQFFASSEKHISDQFVFNSYTTGYKWRPFGADNYVGLETILDVYGFNLQPGQVSAAFIRIGIGRGEGPMSPSQVQVGWHVDPGFYKDSYTHFYVAWNNAGLCKSFICPGFKTTSTGIVPGDVISPVSRFHGHKVFIKLRIFRDKNSGDWHVKYGAEGGDLQQVGYFPRSLISELVDNNVEISFGGYVNQVKPLPSPPMGSGDIPMSGYSASFNGLKLIDEDGHDHLVETDLVSYGDPRGCYPVSPLSYAQFFYGGAMCVD